jgi:hypothetical protein
LDGFIDAAILAISKQALINGSGGPFPPVVRFALPFSSGFEFTVWPAYAPPGGGPLLANNGTQFFVSSHFVTTTEHTLAIWALTNTRSLNFPLPDVNISAIVVDTQPYHFPTQPAVQKTGFHRSALHWASRWKGWTRAISGLFRQPFLQVDCGRRSLRKCWTQEG